MTDLDTLMTLARALASVIKPDTVAAWDDIVGKAQNGPPDGAADGTIDADTWAHARRLADAVSSIAGRLTVLFEWYPHAPRPQTQLDQVVALFNAMPGDVATYVRIAKDLDVLKRHTDPVYRGPERDGTVDERQWGHIRNVARAMRDLAFALKSMENNDDPDIPF